jgi:hypothetical protein
MKDDKRWPYETPEELTAAGYTFWNKSRCSGPTCGAEIEWWKTPAGKSMPLDPDTLEPHFSSCLDAAKFRKGR